MSCIHQLLGQNQAINIFFLLWKFDTYLKGLTKSKEPLEEIQDGDAMSLSTTSDSFQPCSRARVKSETWNQKEEVRVNNLNLVLEEEECDSEESFTTAFDE